MVRKSDGNQGKNAGVEPGDQLGARIRARRGVRQVARRSARLGYLPEPFLGQPGTGVEKRRPELPAVDVYGSLDQLEADFGTRPTDLHRPGIDELVRPNPDDPTGRSMMRRVEEVLDCWFESGSMPFAQVHYPFDNAQWFEGHFPADFIVEYVGQTRGWFYTLHVLGTALFGKPPFENCMAHGVVLGHDKLKLSKRLRNYPDPDEMFNVYGADAMRWFLLSSPVMRGGDLVVERKGPSEAVRSVLNPLWNAWKFFAMYANADGYEAKWSNRATDVLDRYVLSKARLLVDEVTDAMDSYDLYRACTSVTAFLDALEQLVHPPQPGPFLEPLRRQPRNRREQGRRLRHPLHRAPHPLPDGRPVAADGVRDGVPGLDGGAQRSSGRVARPRFAPPGR